jgi:PPOX class probable F420-dependent enzyme
MMDAVLTFDERLWDLVVEGREAVIATIRRDGTPQLSNVLYVADPANRLVRISTKTDTVKVRHLRRDPRAALHITGDDFWAYAVAEGSVTVSDVATTAEEAVIEELRQIHSAFYGPQTGADFESTMIAQRRVVLRVQITRVYGLIATGGRRPSTLRGTGASPAPGAPAAPSG